MQHGDGSGGGTCAAIVRHSTGWTFFRASRSDPKSVDLSTTLLGTANPPNHGGAELRSKVTSIPTVRWGCIAGPQAPARSWRSPTARRFLIRGSPLPPLASAGISSIPQPPTRRTETLTTFQGLGTKAVIITLWISRLFLRTRRASPEPRWCAAAHLRQHGRGSAGAGGEREVVVAGRPRAVCHQRSSLPAPRAPGRLLVPGTTSTRCARSSKPRGDQGHRHRRTPPSACGRVSTPSSCRITAADRWTMVLHAGRRYRRSWPR